MASRRLRVGFGAATACLVLTVSTAHAGQETVEVEGVAAIVNKDVAMARDRAIDDAKRKAVEQVVGSQISSLSVAEDFQLVEERIYARASGFVAKYEIKSETKDPDGTYHVVVRAVVDSGAIADDLDQIFKQKPKVILMIAEQNVGAASYSYWWGRKGFASEMDIMQSALITEWSKKGFEFADPGALAGKLKVSRAMNTPELRDQDALLLAQDADADVAIVGKILVTDSGPVMTGVRMHSFHAVGTLKVLNIDTGAVIATTDDSATAAHIDGNQGGRLAIRALAEKIGEKLRTQIMGKWTREAVGAQKLEVILKGVERGSLLDGVMLFLREEVRGLESVDLRRRRKGTAYLAVSFRGDGLRLSSSVEGKVFEGLRIHVEEASKAKLVLVLAE